MDLELIKKQRAFFDGIKYSIDIAVFSYNRLERALIKYSNKEATSNLTSEDFCGVLIDVWSIIDSIFRLRKIIDSTPGIKNSPERKIFFDQTKKVDDARHYIQHVNEKVSMILDNNKSLWGSLSWCRIYSEKESRICFLKPGTFFNQENTSMVNPLGKIVEPPIDMVTLFWLDSEISISELVRSIKKSSTFLNTKNYPAETIADILATVDLNTH